MKKFYSIFVCLCIAFSMTSMISCSKDDEPNKENNNNSGNNVGNNGGGQSSAYKMKDFVGYWVEEDMYQLYLAEIQTYERQNCNKRTIYDATNYAEVWGIRFDTDGVLYYVNWGLREFKYEPLLYTVHASDGVIYWTRTKLERGYRYTYFIKGNQIMYLDENNKEFLAYKIVSLQRLIDSNDNLLVKVQ